MSCVGRVQRTKGRLSSDRALRPAELDRGRPLLSRAAPLRVEFHTAVEVVDAVVLLRSDQSWKKAEQHVFFRDGQTGHLDHAWNTPGRGIGHEDVTAVYPGDALPGQDPAGFNYLDSEQHVFSVDAQDHLQHWWWAEATNGHGHDTWW